VTDERTPAGVGKGAGNGTGLTYAELLALPTEPAALSQRLGDRIATARAAKGSAPTPAERDGLVAGEALALLEVPGAPPALRAALFRVLAGVGGMRVEGTVRDPLGRSGVKIVTTGANPRLHFVVDPDSGRILFQESAPMDAAAAALPGSSRLLVTAGIVGSITATPGS
jgi:hypothetical protein